MDDNLKKNLEILSFSPKGDFGAMVGYMEDVEFTVTEHPFGQVFLLTSFCSNKRDIGQTEDFVPVSASSFDIANIMLKAYQTYHPVNEDKEKNK